jgi:tetratricopeptide (TPR) repeat protein
VASQEPALSSDAAPPAEGGAGDGATGAGEGGGEVRPGARRAGGRSVSSGPWSRSPWLPALALAALVIAVYARTWTFGFVNLDDLQYVVDNPQVLRGLTWNGTGWAFGSFHAGNWHPLTWLSHMADVQLFGADAGGHHLVSVLLHLANTLLVFAWLRGMTGAPWRSALAAALFAVHPLHVESVAWVSERKDVLSTLFWLLASMAWVRYARRPRPGPYLLSLALFAVGLLAKPMLVTLPFALLLVDVWPLGRLRRQAGAAPAPAQPPSSRAPAGEERGREAALPAASSPAPGGEPGLTRRGDRAFAPATPARLVLEKIPFLLLSAASAAVTVLAQAGTAVVGLARIPLGERVANALVAYVAYLADAFWPAGLSPFYPHPAVAGAGTPAWQAAGAALLLALLSAAAFRWRRRLPALAWGWLWYLGTLVPVIGIVQVGVQARADRYTYVPLLGLCVAVAWGAAGLVERWPATRRAAGAVGAAVLALAAAAWFQVGHWRDSVSLWTHALRVDEHNWQAWTGLGDALAEEGRFLEAVAAHEAAIRLHPGLASAWDGLGMANGRGGRVDVALAQFQEAVRLDPRRAASWYNLGTTHGRLGGHARAAACFREAVRLQPDFAKAWANLAVASLLVGDRAAALDAVQRLHALDPAAAETLRPMLPESARR